MFGGCHRPSNHIPTVLHFMAYLLGQRTPKIRLRSLKYMINGTVMGIQWITAHGFVYSKLIAKIPVSECKLRGEISDLGERQHQFNNIWQLTL